ncbi:MAG: hypothetical protein WBS16_07785 [Thermoplasmata archaeon]
MSISVRTIDNHGHPYRQKVEYRWDPKAKRGRIRILENLGPVHPVYRKSGGAPSTRLPMEAAPFGLLATRMMTGSLTPAQVIDTVREMGGELPREPLEAAGIRFDLREKTLEILLWTRPASPGPRRVRSAPRPGRSSAPIRQPSSRSRDRDT